MSRTVSSLVAGLLLSGLSVATAAEPPGDGWSARPGWSLGYGRGDGLRMTVTRGRLDDSDKAARLFRLEGSDGSEAWVGPGDQGYEFLIDENVDGTRQMRAIAAILHEDPDAMPRRSKREPESFGPPATEPPLGSWEADANWSLGYTRGDGLRLSVTRGVIPGHPAGIGPPWQFLLQGSDGTEAWVGPHDRGYRTLCDRDLDGRTRMRLIADILDDESPDGPEIGRSTKPTFRPESDLGPAAERSDVPAVLGSSDDLPDWAAGAVATLDEAREPGVRAFRGAQFAEPSDAIDDMWKLAEAHAIERVLGDIEGYDRLDPGHRERVMAEVRADTLSAIFVERLVRQTGENEFVVFRAYGRIGNLEANRFQASELVISLLREQQAGGLLFLSVVWVVFGSGLAWLLRGKAWTGGLTMTAAVVFAIAVIRSVG